MTKQKNRSAEKLLRCNIWLSSFALQSCNSFINLPIYQINLNIEVSVVKSAFFYGIKVTPTPQGETDNSQVKKNSYDVLGN